MSKDRYDGGRRTRKSSWAMSANWGLALSIAAAPTIPAPEEAPPTRMAPTPRLPARGDGSGHALAGLLKKRT